MFFHRALLFVLCSCLLWSGAQVAVQAQFEDEFDNSEIDSRADFEHAQQHQNQEQQTIQLTREAVEALLQVFSPPCKLEVESALSSQTTDISDECKYEIQRAFAAYQLQQQGGGEQGQPQQPQQQQQQ